MGEKTVYLHEDEVEDKLDEPGHYRILLHNDDYTTMEFVVQILKTIFRKTIPEANNIMLEVHNKGFGTVGHYTYDIAATKVIQVENRASRAGYPLRCTMERE